MNKAELIAIVAKESNISAAAAGRVIDAMTGSITGSLQAGEAVQLIGFGTFKVNKRAARSGRNPQTGKEIKIAARNAPAFAAGKTLKDAVN